MTRSTKRVAGSVREQVIADLKMAGLSRGTQGVYLWCMDRFFQATWVAPERATQEQVAAYLQRMIDRGTCAGTFKPVRAALQFLFENTLERSWKVFKKDVPCPRGDGCRMPRATRSAAASSALSAIPSIAPALP